MPALCITVNRGGKKTFGIAYVFLLGSGWESISRPCPYQRRRLQMWTETDGSAPSKLSAGTLKMEEQCSRTPVGEALRALALTSGYPNVSDCEAFSKKLVSSVCVCTGACTGVVKVFQNRVTQNMNSIAYLFLRYNKKILSCYILGKQGSAVFCFGKD